MNKLIQVLVATLALSAFTASNNGAMAQPPAGHTDSTTASSEPSLDVCRAEYGREICQPTVPTGGTVVRRRPPAPRWYVVVNGNLEGSRQHGEIETDYGHTEYGIGGSAECPEGTIPLVIAASGLRYLHDEANHTFATGTFCAPLGAATPGTTVNIDVSEFVTIEMFETLVHRLEADERTLFLHMCEGYDVSWEEWFAATPEHRNELCPSRDGRQNARLDRIEDRLDNLPANTGGHGVFDNLDISFDAGANLFRTGIAARSIEIGGALQLTLWPSTHARFAPTLRLRMGGGAMNDHGGIEIQHPVRLTVGVGAQALLGKRLRLDVLVTTAGVWSNHTNSSGLGDGLRARNGIGGEVGLVVNLNRSGHADTGAGLVPFLRADLEVMSLQYNLLNDNAQDGFVRRTSFGAGLSLGVRWGLRGRHP
ncbi:MAG: hypothetical protein U0487_01295 [Patescibacteria group bacterium]